MRACVRGCVSSCCFFGVPKAGSTLFDLGLSHVSSGVGGPPGLGTRQPIRVGFQTPVETP